MRLEFVRLSASDVEVIHEDSDIVMASGQNHFRISTAQQMRWCWIRRSVVAN